jgi:hypothetical protein
MPEVGQRREQLPRKPSAFSVVVVVVVLLVAAWFVRNTEWGPVEIPTPLRGEAATNAFYAAQKLVERLGGTSERREALGDTPSDAVIVLSTWSWDIDDARRAEFERWVENGGRLVVDAALITGSDAFEQWTGILHEDEEVDPDADVFQAPEIVEPCVPLDELGTDVGEVSSGVYTACEFDHTTWFETDERILWGLRDGDLLRAARVAVGQGRVTVINGVPFVYRELLKGDHGELLAAAAELKVGDHVVFMSEADVASLPELVWRYGAPVVAVLLLWIALALWRGAMRFGPLVAPTERARRSLAEQVLGTGRFVLRVGGGAALAAAARRALHEAAARRVVGHERLAVAAQAEAVAGLARVDAGELAAALDPQVPSRPLELRAKLALLEAARRELVSGSQRSKHGKRI